MTTLAHVSLSHLTTEALVGLAGLAVMAVTTWLIFRKSNQGKTALRRVRAIYRRFDR